MTDYLRLAQERAPQSPDVQDNPYLPLAREQQNLQQNRARTVIESALQGDPDIAAERLRLSQTSGVPLPVVERNLEALRLKERARAIDLIQLAQESPVLYRQLVDPTFTTTSIDDLDTLKNLERSVGRGVRYVMGADGKGGLPSDLAGAAKSVALGGTVGVGKMAFDVAGTVNDLIGWQSGAQAARGTARRLQGVMDEYGFQPESSTGQAVRSGLQSAGTNLAILPVGLYRGLYATANQAASTVAGILSAGVGSAAFNEAREQGRNQLQAAVYAIPQGTFEYVFERIPAAKLFGDLAANTGLLKLLGRQTLSEGWTEQLTTLTQDFNEWMNLNPDKTLAEFIQERPEAAYQTFIATLVGVGVQTSTIKGINKVIEAASDRSLQFDQDLLQQQMQLAATSMLRQRSPEQFRAHVQRVVDANDGAKKEVYVDAEVLNQLAPNLLAQLPESVREQIPGALEANSTVAVPMADVLTVAPGTELEQILNDNARMRPNAPSRVEAQLTEQFLRQEADRVLAQAADTQAWQQSSEQVKTAILEQLNSTGRFTPDVNDAYATLQANFFSTMAARVGLTPQELFERYNLKVAARGPGGQVLNSGLASLPVTLEGREIPVTQNVWDARAGDTLVNVDPATFDRGFARDNAYVGPQGEGGIEGRYSRFAEWQRTAKSIEASSVSVRDNGLVVFGNGRHRYAFMRDQGVQQIPVSMDEDSLRNAIRFGYVDASAGQQVLNQSATIRRGKETLDKYGLTPGKKYKTREVAAALEARQRAKYGTIAADDRSPEAMTNISKWMVAEVEFAMDNPETSGVGWYSEKFQRALDIMAEQFPELATDKTARNTMTALIAITSDGQKVVPNFAQAMDIYGRFRTGGATEGKFTTTRGHQRQASIDNNLAVLQRLYDQMGAEAMHEYLMQEKTISALKKLAKANGGDLKSDYQAHIKMPMAAVEFGPKLGAFYANLMGAHGYLTMDRWWSRTFNRYRGTLLQAPTRQGLDRFKELLGNPEMSDDEAIAATVEPRNAYEAKGFKNGTELEKAANTIYKAAFENLEDSPFNATDRTFMLDAVNKAQKSLARKGYNLSVADIQAILWYYEKRLYGELGARQTADISYEEAAQRVVAGYASGSGVESLLDDAGATQQDGGAGEVRVPVGEETFEEGPDSGLLNQEPLAQGPRGTFSPEQLLVTLNENADLSTFLHESGHFFLEVLADLASQANTPQQIKDDMAATLKWFGVPDLATWNNYTLDQKRPYHERWAESFEQYLFEGKAPSPELQPLFRRFRSWLVNVYKSLTEFMRARNLKVNDEVRQVFGRLMATDEQIAQAEEAAGMLPDFEATNEAIEALQARSLRDLKWVVRARGKTLKELEKQAKTLRKEVEAEVRAEVEQQPVYRAMTWLKKGETTDPATGDLIKAEKGFRLSTEALAEMYPETMLGRPDLTRLRGMTGKEGLHPDMVADMFGYETGDQLVRAILDAESIASVVEGITDQRMLERHGDLATSEAREAAANEAVHNEARARALATELKSQAEMMNQRQDTGRTDVRGRPITVNTVVEAAKQFALNLAARRRLKDLKNAAWQHRAAEARAGKRWQQLTSEGKSEEAVQAKRDQLLNNYAAKALQDAQVEVRKTLEFFKRVTQGNDEKTVERGRDPDVVNAMRAILAAYDVAPRLEKSAIAYMETVSRNDPTMYAALKPSVDTAMLNAKPLPEMTMEELRGLADELRAMWVLAKRSRQMEVDGNLMDIEDAADELMARMDTIGIPAEIPGERGAITDREERGLKLQFAKSILSRVEQWAERLDGAFGGPFLRLVFQPVKDAADRYRTDRVAYRKKFTEMLQAIAPQLPPGPIEAPELGYTFGNARDSGTAELLHAILHTGNDSNKRKLLLGRGWASENADGTLDTSRWDAFITRMIGEGKINQAHYDFAQGVWDLLEEMKPLAQETHRKVFGRYFAEVTANEVITPFGTYRGGYVPAQTDSRLVKDAKLRELAEGENESMAYAFPAAPSGFTKSRVEYNQPLLLDLRALGQHMDKVLLFSHLQGAVTDVRRLLTNKRVSYALDRIDPGAYEGMLIPWLNRAAKQVVETPVVGDRKLSRFLSAARSRAGMALMFANLSNTFQQITGFSLAGVKVKPGLMMSATAQFIADPKAMKTEVAEASPYMKDRMLNEVGAMNDAIEEILVNPTLLQRGQAWTNRHAYFMQAAVDNTMSPIIWTAAYNQAIEQGQDAKEAVRFADGVIRQTQGSTLPEDISRFESGPGYARLFTQFVSYFNMMANTNATAVKQIAGEMGIKKGAGKILYVALAGLLVPIWVAEAIAQAFKGGPEDEDKDGWIDDWLLAVFGLGTLKGLAAQIPLVGQAAQLVVNRFNDNPADDKFSLSPAVSLIESSVSAPSSVYKAIVDDGNVQKAARDVAAAATLLTGLPIYGLQRPIGYLAGIAGGDIEPTGPVDLARGVITGTASPESKQR
jgi:hypothetical protein